MDTHTRHCCAEHGCKYGDAHCTVTTGTAEQAYPCEQCDHDIEDLRQIADRNVTRQVLTDVLTELLEPPGSNRPGEDGRVDDAVERICAAFRDAATQTA